ncbi:hypothetical protein [Streptomyces sp. NPDC005773]|uniref:hypothetical protein n=1 Tax=Streptomyces sp. NPDC005773 TaxID=3364727 RepID=UPI00368B1390
MRTAREVKTHAPHCLVILTVYEMKRLGRDTPELTALPDHLTALGRCGQPPSRASGASTGTPWLTAAQMPVPRRHEVVSHPPSANSRKRL